MVTSCAVMVFRGACATFPAHGSLSMFSTLHSVFNPAFVSVPYQFLCYVLVLASRQGVSFFQWRDRHSGADRSDRFTCKQLIKHVTATFRWQLWWRLQTIDNEKKKKGNKVLSSVKKKQAHRVRWRQSVSNQYPYPTAERETDHCQEQRHYHHIRDEQIQTLDKGWNLVRPHLTATFRGQLWWRMKTIAETWTKFFPPTCLAKRRSAPSNKNKPIWSIKR